MPITFTSIRFYNFKAFRDFSVSLQRMNILVGPNNCGKSTIISAFRILEVGLKQAFKHRAMQVPSFRGGHTFGHLIPIEHIPVATENVHTDYDEDTDARIVFRVSNGNKLFLHFPVDGGCYLSWETQGPDIQTPGLLRRAFPIKIQVIPVLGPLEHEESVLTENTVKRGLNTHRASRHFRNYWRYFPEGFNDFAALVARSWPGMEIEEPELLYLLDQKLTMMCRENRISREIFWAGFGFQIWCQILTHISRASDATILIVDEPEIYLHPDVQRQLLGILRDISPDILLATHSTEIMGEADYGEIILIDKRKRAGERLKDIEGVQRAHEVIGSVQNITLTQFARTKKILFVEGGNDYKILRRFAKNLGFEALAAGTDITALESGGFSSWEKVKALSWGLNRTIGADIFIGAIYDRDYWCEEEVRSISENMDRHLNFSHIHNKKEIENYLLAPAVLDRALEHAIRDRERRTATEIALAERAEDILLRVTAPKQNEIQGQYLAKRSEFFRHSGRDVATINAETLDSFNTMWANLATRLSIVPGKEILRLFRAEVERLYSVTLTDIRIIDAYAIGEIPEDISQLIQSLENCRTEGIN